MPDFYGADTARLRELAAAMDTQAEALREIHTQVSGSVDSMAWGGPDAEEFTTDWHYRDAQNLMACVNALIDSAKTVRSNADAQDQTSAADAGGGIPAIGGSAADRAGKGDAEPPYKEGFDNEKDWKRLRYSEEYIESDEALDSANTAQGGLGDCWFIASLTAVADRDPDFIRDHMTRNANGTWTVTMYHDGKPVEITVGPLFPEGGGHSANGEMNYVTIYEAAAVEYEVKYGKGTGSYADIEGGNAKRAFDMITGQETRHVPVSPNMFQTPVTAERLQDQLDKGPIYVSSKTDPADAGSFLWLKQPSVQDSRVAPDHAYILEEVIPLENGGYDVVVRNPWGPGSGDTGPGNNSIRLSEKEFRENYDDMYFSTDPR